MSGTDLDAELATLLEEERVRTGQARGEGPYEWMRAPRISRADKRPCQTCSHQRIGHTHQWREVSHCATCLCEEYVPVGWFDNLVDNIARWLPQSVVDWLRRLIGRGEA